MPETKAMVKGPGVVILITSKVEQSTKSINVKIEAHRVVPCLIEEVNKN